MGKKIPCCVPDCKDKVSVRHRFPRGNEVYNCWLERIQNPTLASLEKKKVYDTYLVCDRHFNDVCKNDGSKCLKIYSVPTLHLPDFQEGSTKENSFLYPSDIRAAVSKETITSTSQEKTFKATVSKENGTSCLQDETLVMEGVQPLEPCTPTLSVHQQYDATVCKETNMSCLQGETLVMDGVQPLEPGTPTVFVHEQNNGVEQTVRKSLLKGLAIKRQKELTPKAKKLYKEAVKLQRHKMILASKVKSYKYRVKLAEKFSSTKLFENVSNKVNDVTYRFFLSQLKSQKVSPKVRRFTLDDKVLALSLTKQGSKGYKLLSQYFALPSKRTLSKVLQRLCFEPGVNMNVMNHLKITVARLHPKDRYCCLLFDEMSIQPNIRYDEHGDIIEGFQDFGDGQRKPVFSDHVLVFMIRGIRRRWKQPITYAFVEGSTKTTDLVRCIKEVVMAVQQTGLKIVATVCDQGASNQAAVNYLLKETDEICKKKNVENHYFGMVIDGEEIIPLFDPPHLLKGIRNNLLIRDVVFVCGKGKQVASWKDILQVYEIDSQHHKDELRACPKFTEEHVVIDKINKMKVKNCSQVFSQRLSAIMRLLAQCDK